MEDSNHQSTLSSGALIGFNDDLLTDILLWLPATSILRFKSVSKHWRWLLSQRSFTLRFDKLSKSRGLFVGNVYVPFDVENRSPPPFRTHGFCIDPCGIKIIQSCNGLLFCSSNTTKVANLKYYVFNPTTMQHAIIPLVPGGHDKICFMRLAFDQTDFVHYKIICICALKLFNDLFQIQIYSSNTRQWKISIESFSMKWPSIHNGVYCNKAIHWCSFYRECMYSFKVDVEQIQTMPLPVSSGNFYNVLSAPLYFGESRGHLHLVEAPFHMNRLHLNVYEMLTDHSGWFVKYQVELHEVARMYGLEFGFHVCDVVRGEKEKDSFMVLNIPGKMIMYNFHNKSFVHIFNLNNGGSPHAFRYTESLASLL